VCAADLDEGVAEKVKGEIAEGALLVISGVPLLELVLIADVTQDGLGLPEGESVVVLRNG